LPVLKNARRDVRNGVHVNDTAVMKDSCTSTDHFGKAGEMGSR